MRDGLLNRLFFFFLLGGTVVLMALFGGPYAYLVLSLCMSLLVLWEFYRIFERRGYAAFPTPGLWIAGGVHVLSFLTYQGVLDHSWTYALPILLLCPWLFFLFINDRKPSEYIARMGITWVGLFYAAFPFVLLHDVLFIQGPYDGILLLRLVSLTCSMDLLSYLFGATWGKRRLFPSVSPQKTWSGCIGGGIGAVVVALLFSYWLDETLIQHLFWMVLALLTATSGVLGDLVESKIKRALNVKNSGQWLGEQGGFLDRCDNLLFSIPVWWVVVRAMDHGGCAL